MGDRGLSQESGSKVVSRKVCNIDEVQEKKSENTARSSKSQYEDSDMEEPRNPFKRYPDDEEEKKGGEEEEKKVVEERLGEEEEDDAEKPKTREMPKGPTKKERQVHEATHLPFRSWCRHCVRGRGRNNPHKKQGEGTEEVKDMRIPRIHMDYFFMSQEEEKAGKNPLMLMIDDKYGHRYMRAVGGKGVGEGTEMEWLVKDMHDELKAWGYTGGPNSELIIKSDGERSIVAAREALGRYHGGQVTPEQPPRGESQANGKIEEAGRTVRGMAKVLKDQMENKAGIQIDSDAGVMQWAVRWAAMLLSRFKLGEDGKTAYERQKGKKCNLEVLPFGERVL